MRQPLNQFLHKDGLVYYSKRFYFTYEQRRHEEDSRNEKDIPPDERLREIAFGCREIVQPVFNAFLDASIFPIHEIERKKLEDFITETFASIKKLRETS